MDVQFESSINVDTMKCTIEECFHFSQAKYNDKELEPASQRLRNYKENDVRTPPTPR